jgi:Domain of unknown function (DUF4160)
MPKILLFRNLFFFFYGGDINERGHLHIGNQKGYVNNAKIWFENGIELFEQGSLTEKEISQALKVITQQQTYIQQQWDNFKHGEQTKIKTIKKI